jgi:anti-sigma regulatory factor (Ser/Thr protein kinase)
MIFQAAPQERDSPPRVVVELTAGPDAPAQARGAIKRLEATMPPPCLEIVELVLSELVTNAVRHSGVSERGRVEVDVRCGPRAVLISVADPGPGFDPEGRGGPRGAEGGWGLYVVGEVADRWWVEQAGEGTRVVAEVARG